MGEIGSSYIAWPDLLIFGVAMGLFYGVTTCPPGSLEGRVLAILCGCNRNDYPHAFHLRPHVQAS
jgi:hypothetical protein